MLVLLLVLLTPALALNCSNSHPLAGSSCIFHSIDTTSCDSLVFANCSWQECDGWLASGKTFICSHYSTKYDASWQSCTQKCCPTAGPLLPSWQSVQTCQDAISQASDSQSRALMILLITLGVLAVSIVTICCLLRHCKSSTAKVAEEQRNEGMYADIARPTQTLISEPKLDSKPPSLIHRWVDAPEHFEKAA